MKKHKDKEVVEEVDFKIIEKGEDEDGEFAILELTPKKNKGEKHGS